MLKLKKKLLNITKFVLSWNGKNLFFSFFFFCNTNSNNKFSLIPADLFQLRNTFTKVMFVSDQRQYFTYVTGGLFNPLKMSV